MDQVHQSKRLVQSLQPKPELWKVLRRNRVDYLWCSRTGGPWKANITLGLLEGSLPQKVVKCYEALESRGDFMNTK